MNRGVANLELLFFYFQSIEILSMSPRNSTLLQSKLHLLSLVDLILIILVEVNTQIVFLLSPKKDQYVIQINDG